MADKFSYRGNYLIPSTLFDEYEWAADAFIDSLGKNCTLIYPVKFTECPNCYTDPDTNKSSNVYKTGGPAPFANHTVCPWCGGLGRSEESVTESIKLRIYWTPKNWVQIGPKFENPDGVAQIIGYITHMPKIKKMQEIIIESDEENFVELRCKLEGEVKPWGLSRRYFVAFVRRLGGG